MHDIPWMRACLGLLLVVPAAAWASDLIGRTVPPYPHGLQDIGGSCLSDSTDYERVCDYSIGLLGEESSDSQAGALPRYIIAGRLAGRDGQHARWTITDALPYPQKAGQQFQLQIGTCRTDGNDDSRVVALVRQDLISEFLTDVAWARRLDLASGRFLPVTGKVDCFNEAYLGF